MLVNTQEFRVQVLKSLENWKKNATNPHGSVRVNDLAVGVSSAFPELSDSQVYAKLNYTLRKLLEEGLVDKPKKGYYVFVGAPAESKKKKSVRKKATSESSDETQTNPDVLDRSLSDASLVDTFADVLRKDYDSLDADYHPDPYFRSIARNRLRCFGWFNTRSKTCRECPFQESCQREALLNKLQIAVEIERAEEIKNAPPPPSVSNEESPVEISSKDKGQDIIAVTESICQLCMGKIVKHEPAKWYPNVGVVHVKCALKSQKNG